MSPLPSTEGDDYAKHDYHRQSIMTTPAGRPPAFLTRPAIVRPLALGYGGSHQRAHRLTELAAAGVCGRRFWRTVFLEWSGFDAIPQVDFPPLFRRYRADWSPDLMTPKDREFYERLPRLIEVYWGGRSINIAQLCWTTDRAIAEGFARGHRGIVHPDPEVLAAWLPKSRVAFVQTDRDESEVVTWKRFTPSQGVRDGRPWKFETLKSFRK